MYVKSMRANIGRRCRVWSGASFGQYGIIVNLGGRRGDLYCVRLDSGQYRLKNWLDVQLVSHSARNIAPSGTTAPERPRVAVMYFI